MKTEMCCCGWTGESFELHHEETKESDLVHVEVSPLMILALGKVD